MEIGSTDSGIDAYNGTVVAKRTVAAFQGDASAAVGLIPVQPSGVSLLVDPACATGTNRSQVIGAQHFLSGLLATNEALVRHQGRNENHSDESQVEPIQLDYAATNEDDYNSYTRFLPNHSKHADGDDMQIGTDAVDAIRSIKRIESLDGLDLPADTDYQPNQDCMDEGFGGIGEDNPHGFDVDTVFDFSTPLPYSLDVSDKEQSIDNGATVRVCCMHKEPSDSCAGVGRYSSDGKSSADGQFDCLQQESIQNDALAFSPQLSVRPEHPAPGTLFDPSSDDLQPQVFDIDNSQFETNIAAARTGQGAWIQSRTPSSSIKTATKVPTVTTEGQSTDTDRAVDDTSRQEQLTAPKFRPSHTDRWQERYNELVEFWRSHGHCLVDNSYSATLCHWVKRQRYNYTLKKRNQSSVLTDDRQQKLERLNFAWDSHDAMWETRFLELVEFKKQNGHTNVPVSYKLNRQLGIWIKGQRKQYWKDVANGHSEAAAARKHRYERLNDLGFQWELRPHQRRRSQARQAVSEGVERKAPAKHCG